jgi:hypothetical protein
VTTVSSSMYLESCIIVSGYYLVSTSVPATLMSSIGHLVSVETDVLLTFKALFNIKLLKGLSGEMQGGSKMGSNDAY